MTTKQNRPIHTDATPSKTNDDSAEWVEVLRGGDRIRIRQIHRDDKDMERAFIETLSSQSRRFRFRGSMLSPGDALLRLLTEIEGASEIAYVAVLDTISADRQVGVARFSVDADGGCEFAVVVDDAWQNKGIGTHLMRHLIDAAKVKGISTMYSNDSTDNHLMRRFAKHLNLRQETDPADSGQTIYTAIFSDAEESFNVRV